MVFETGDADPTPASSPVPTPTRFEATGLRYRFLGFDPADPARVSAVKEWTAKLRLKYQLHNRGDHYEVELLALPKANGIAIRYTTDGVLAHQHGFGDLRRHVPCPGQLPHRLRHGRRRRLRAELRNHPHHHSAARNGSPARSTSHPPARWNQQTKLDDAGAVWDFLQRLEAGNRCDGP